MYFQIEPYLYIIWRVFDFWNLLFLRLSELFTKIDNVEFVFPSIIRAFFWTFSLFQLTAMSLARQNIFLTLIYLVALIIRISKWDNFSLNF